MNLTVIPIHNSPKYLQDCCNLLNEQWKRSDTARLHSLSSSSDQFPTSLILLKDEKLIGHAKLSIIPRIPNACFIESVVIEKTLRGKGYGTFLMKKAEEYVNGLCLDTIYLSTYDMEEFYTKLGYCKCPPICIYGSATPSIMEKVSLPLKVNVPAPPSIPIQNKVVSSKMYMKKNLPK